MRKNIESGFTIIELLVLTTMVLGFVLLSIPNYSDYVTKLREEEVKVNIQTIQVAIERYYVDHQFYPPFLIGGDNKGWKRWHQLNDEPVIPQIQNKRGHFDLEPSNIILCDVLLKFGYLADYPTNPFVTDGMRIISSTSVDGTGKNGALQPGDGDPRFGFYGNRMGNGLSVPDYFVHRISGIPPVDTSICETKRTLSDRTVKELGFCEPPVGLHYMMGGRKAFDSKGNIITVATWWPGNFFYYTDLPRTH